MPIRKSSKFKAFDPSSGRGFQSLKFGFTLMELIVAMAILAILATGGVSSYIRSLKRGRDAQRKSDLAQVQRALEAYFNDKGSYPSGDGQIEACGDDGSVACTWGEDSFEDKPGGTGKAIYMKLLPKDPAANQRYFYRAAGAGLSYQLYTKLENEDDPQAGGLTSPPNCGADVCNYGVSSSNTTP